MLAAHGYGCDHIVGISRDDEPDRNLAVVRPIGCVQRAAARVKADLAANLALQRPFEVDSLGECIDRLGVRTEWQGDDHHAIGWAAGTSSVRLRRAAVTPPSRWGTPATRRPISMPLSVAASIKSLKLPRCPILTTFPASFDRPMPSDMSK